MKILQVVHTFLPKFVAGTEVYTFGITQALKKAGHDVRIVYTDPLADSYSLKKVNYKGINCYEIQKDINNIYSFEDSFQDKQVENFFMDVLNDFKPDIIHYQHIMFLSTKIIEVAKKKNIRQIISLHDFWFQCLTHKRITTDHKLCINPTLDKCVKCHFDLLNRTISVPPFRLNNLSGYLTFLEKKGSMASLGNKIKKRIENLINYNLRKNKLKEQLLYRLNAFRTALKSVDTVIYPTKFLQQELYLWSLKGSNDLISSDGIQDKYFKTFKRARSKIIRFGFIGSIVQAKGLIVLVSAWEKIKDNNTTLKIYGSFTDDPDYSKHVMTIVKRCHNIEVKGSFKPDWIAKVFEDIDVLIVPSTWFENAPLVIRNAFLSHTPVITTNLGSLPELINEKNSGLLFENENADDLAEKINSIIKDRRILNNFKFPKQKNVIENAEELIGIYKNFIKNNEK